MTCGVYRFFSSAGDLLYIGATANPFKRLQNHASDTSWIVTVTRVEIQWTRTKHEATLLERQAIIDEKPLHNVHWNLRGAKK